MRVTWAALGEKIDQLEKEVAALRAENEVLQGMLEEQEREIVRLKGYKQAVLKLADSLDLACGIFEERP